jgi:hypothetical protein
VVALDAFGDVSADDDGDCPGVEGAAGVEELEDDELEGDELDDDCPPVPPPPEPPPD